MEGRGATPGVVALRDTSGDGKADVKERIGDKNSTGIALRNGYLYVGTTTSIERYKLTPGELKPAGRGRSGRRGPSARPPASRQGDRVRRQRIRVRQRRRAVQRLPAAGPPAKSRRPGPCPLLESTAASGVSTKTSSARSRPTEPASRPACVRCLRSPGTTARLYTAMNSRDQLDTLWPDLFKAEDNVERPSEALYRVDAERELRLAVLLPRLRAEQAAV